MKYNENSHKWEKPQILLSPDWQTETSILSLKFQNHINQIPLLKRKIHRQTTRHENKGIWNETISNIPPPKIFKSQRWSSFKYTICHIWYDFAKSILLEISYSDPKFYCSPIAISWPVYFCYLFTMYMRILYSYN